MSITDNAVQPDDNAAPLVSVIIRSIGRETLRQALDSVALQTYPNIEVVVVNAKGPGHPEVGEWCGRFPIHVYTDGEPLRRSRAANLGLDNARGNFLIFLDDDDWFLPDHLTGLVQEITSHDGMRVVYSGIRCMSLADNGSWEEVRNFNYNYDRTRIWFENYIPIHAVLFSHDLVNDGCRFDENLDVYEDWDFWIQVSLRSSFAHVDHISAIYRITTESGHGVHGEIGMEQHASALLYFKWRHIWSDEQFLEIMKYAKTRWYIEEDRSVLLAERKRAEESSLQHEILKRRQKLLCIDLESLEDELDRIHAKTHVRVESSKGILRTLDWIIIGSRNFKTKALRVSHRANDSVKRVLAEIVRTIRGNPPHHAFWILLLRASAKITRHSIKFPAHGEYARHQTLPPEPFHFPRSEEVELSIVVTATCGYSDIILQCLKAIHDHVNPNIPYEVIVSGTLDDTSKSTACSVPGLKHVSPALRHDLVDCWEAGIQASRGNLVAVVPDYFVAQHGWSGALIETFNRGPDLGMIAPKVVSSAGKLRSAGGVIRNDGTLSVRGDGDNPNMLNYSYLQEIDCPTEPCFVVRRELFGVVGGFNRNYLGWPSQLADFSLNVVMIGQKVMYHPFVSFVEAEAPLPQKFHAKGEHGGGESDDDSHLLSHRFQLHLKYLQRQRPITELRRTGRGRMLVIDVIVPTPDKDAGSMRIFRMLEILKNLSYDITFLPANLEYKQVYVESLQSRGINVLYSPHIDSIDQYLNEEGQKFDVIMISRVEIAYKLIDLIKRHAPNAFVIFDTVDLHFLREERRAGLTGDQKQMARAIECRREELEVAYKADITLVVSDVEKRVLLELAPSLHVELVSLIHDLSPSNVPFAKRDGIMFIGGYAHPPNVDAVQYFISEIYPIIGRSLGKVNVYIVGSNPPPELYALASENIIVTGYIPDASPFLNRCRLSFAPLRFGAGVKGKIILSMSHGLPVVASTVAVEGMHLSDGVDVLIADDPALFAEAIVRLYQDEELWNRLSTNGFLSVETHFSVWSARRALRRSLELRYLTDVADA